MSRIRFRFLRLRSMPQSGQRSNSCLMSHNSETTEANLMKFHRKIKHNEEVCTEVNLLFKKIKHNEKVFHL